MFPPAMPRVSVEFVSQPCNLRPVDPTLGVSLFLIPQWKSRGLNVGSCTLLYAAKNLWVSNGWLPPNTSMGLPSINPLQLSFEYGVQHVNPIHAERTSSAAGSIAYNPSVCTAISDAPVCHPYETNIQMSLAPCFPAFCICKILGSTSTCMIARTSAVCFKPFSNLLQPSMTFPLFVCCYAVHLRIRANVLVLQPLQGWQMKKDLIGR